MPRTRRPHLQNLSVGFHRLYLPRREKLADIVIIAARAFIERRMRGIDADLMLHQLHDMIPENGIAVNFRDWGKQKADDGSE